MMENKFDPHAALKHKQDIRDAERNCIEEAIALIEDDRPNAAKRLLFSGILEGSVANDLNRRSAEAIAAHQRRASAHDRN